MSKRWQIMLGCGHDVDGLTKGEAVSLWIAEATTCPVCGYETTATGAKREGGLTRHQSEKRLTKTGRNRKTDDLRRVATETRALITEDVNQPRHRR